ncbi:MAG TPA: GAF and ANTAR domain-containing protein [Marmoricola sp.]|nr:GAF and ANTAR domain-containing protein [Marmoricola sp.]
MAVERSAPALELAKRFATLSQELLAEHDEKVLLDVICTRAPGFVPWVDFCGITLRGPRRRLETACSTGPIAQQSDDLQRELGEGPCLEAAHDVQHLYVSGDVAADQRWPTWGPAAAGLGVQSLISVKLSSTTINSDHAPLGALNMYSGELHRFGDDEVETARIYALHAANALAQARLVTGLRTAVDSRHTIGLAQGVLIQRYGLDPDAAFDVLQRYSTTTNTKLRLVAREVLANGGLPEQTNGSPTSH